MNLEIFTIYDRKAGIYAAPFLSHNAETAARQFNYQMQKAEMVALDCELYKIGTFDSLTGVIVSHKPDFICNYGQEVKHE